MTLKAECKHELQFRESIPQNQKWFCRYCFEEIPN